MKGKKQSNMNSNKQLAKKQSGTTCCIILQSSQLKLQKQWQFKFATPLQIVLKQMNQYVSSRANGSQIIGFQTKSQDILFDFCLAKKIGVLQNNYIIKPIVKQVQKVGLNKYKLVKCLATGGFSKVYLSRSLISGQYFASKFIDKQKVCSEDKNILIMNQKKVNQMSSHPFLVKMHQFIETDNFFVLVMDYCPGGQLFFLLRSIKRMSQEQARIYFVQILLGIQYLHKQGIMYRDLKPQNIMLDEAGHIKIADFGLAKLCRQKSYSFCGSIQYMSPQIVTNLGHSFQVDFYCLGALLFQILVGCPPFYDPELTEYQTKKNIAYCQVQFPDEIQMSQQVKDLIQKLLIKNPKKRLGHFGGAKQIMLHPWVRKVDRKQYQQKKMIIPYPPKLNRFNFDPDEIGVSQERFTNKIKHQYSILNAEKQIFRRKKANNTQKHIVSRQSTLSKQKDRKKSPYLRNSSLDKVPKKYSKSKIQPYNALIKTQFLKNIGNNTQTIKNLAKRMLSKKKSPSFSVDKKKNINKNSKELILIPCKFYSSIKTQYNNKIEQKKIKKQNTQANEQNGSIDKIFYKFKQNIPNELELKKSSKLKLKKKKGSNFLAYGKEFRQACVA